jgi:hypothetical protein
LSCRSLGGSGEDEKFTTKSQSKTLPHKPGQSDAQNRAFLPYCCSLI